MDTDSTPDHSRVTVRDEGEGFKRAVCSCGADQVSPSKTLTQADAEAWHRMHAETARRFEQTVPPERRRAVQAGMAQLLIDMEHLSHEEPIGWVLAVHDPEGPHTTLRGVALSKVSLGAYQVIIDRELNQDGDEPPFTTKLVPLYALGTPDLRQLVDPQELVGAAEFAAMAGVTRTSAVSNYAARYDDFPKPVAQVRATPLWRKADVRAFLRRHPTLGSHPRPKEQP